MSFWHPWALVALVIPLAVIAGLWLSGRRRGTAWTVASWLAVAAAIVALSAPVAGDTQPAAVLAVDRSASIDASMNAAENHWISHAGASCPKPCRVVEFAAGS